MKNGIIFDLDGTLWDSVQQVVKSWNQVFKESKETDYVMTNEDMKKLMGKTIKEIASIALRDVPTEKALEIMKECCKEELYYLNKYGGILYPHLEETLHELSKSYKLFIVSNCEEGYIESFLNYHNLSKYFVDYENHGRTNLSKGENIKLVIKRNNLEKAVYVGDTQGDFHAAKHAGIPFIHAKYGFGNVDEEVCFISEVRELVGILKV